ncbi:unnamed protein product [Brassicogethes aeneus]|uniref:Phospholipase A2-like domain-containing protein n=1 Tax=Brassicogethes aeneus TaxID=1431903 RepID=A0A9P0BGJ2_BRAAE|nr:unnamed protein product [Brassicogethes aeneus]
MAPFLFPGHKYLGPGNEINGEEPIDEDDRIALIHDISYLESHSDQEIRDADLIAIQDFIEDIQETGNWHSAVGALEMPSSTTKRPTHAGNKRYADQVRQISEIYKKRKQEGQNINWPDFIKEFHRTSSKGPQAGPSHTSTSTTNRPASPVADRNQVVPDNFWNLDMDNFDETMLEVPSNIQTVQSNSTGRDIGSRSGGNFIRLYKSPMNKSYEITFEKSFVWYSYGYNFEILNIAKESINYRTTPFALIPVDYIPSYLTYCGYSNLPNNSFVKHVHCSVKILGVRTAFDTGTSLSGVANSEHVSLCASMIGLNKVCSLSNCSYKADATKPMIPTDVEDWSDNNYVKKLYTDAASGIMGAPRSVNAYACIHENYSKAPTNTPTYPVHANGPPFIEKLMNRYHVGSHVGQTIVEYNYTPEYAPINLTPSLDLPIGPETDTLDNTSVFTQSRGVQQKKDGLCGIGGASKPFDGEASTNVYQTTKTYEYKQCIEKPYVFHPHKHKVQPAQPQLHVGLLPTPKLNPSVEGSDIQNSSIYYEVTFKMKVEANHNGLYADSTQIHSKPSEIVFHNSRRMPYNGGGRTMLGYWDVGL